jgi:hypothetical protein
VGMTIVRTFVEDEDGKKVSGAWVEITAPRVEVIKHGDKTDAEGKITWTLRTEAVGAGEVFMVTCRASQGGLSVSEQFALPANQPHDILIVLSPRPSDPRTFRRFKAPTQFSKPPVNAFAALEVDEARGKIKPVILKNEGQAFTATKWEKANCVPIGKRDFVPVVDRKGTVSGWYLKGVSSDNLYTSAPKDGQLPPPERILYIPGHLVGEEYTQTRRDLEAFGFRTVGFAGGSGGDHFGVLFDIAGNVLGIHYTDRGQGSDHCGPGGIFMCDPLWDKVEMAMGFGGILRGLTKRFLRGGGFKTFGRRGGDEPDDIIMGEIEGKVVDTHRLNQLVPSKNLRIPITRLDVKYARKVAELLFQRSPWMRELRRIKRIGNMETRYKAIETFIKDYHRATGIEIVVAARNDARLLELVGGNWGKYYYKEDKIFMHEDIWTNPRLDTVGEIAHEVGAAELDRVLKVDFYVAPPRRNIPPKLFDNDTTGIPYLDTPFFDALTHAVDDML